MEITNKTKCLISDLEMQIDFLVGYSSTGAHWKREYYVRKELIEAVLGDENTPQEIKDKIELIEDSLMRLRNGDKHNQEYLKKDEEKKYRFIPIRGMGVICEEWLIMDYE